MTAFIPVFLLFPIMNLIAARQGVSRAVWAIVGLQIVLSLGISLCYGCIFIFISASAPNKASLGSVNGIAQVMVSIVRTIGPAAANSLFSLSMKHRYMGGWMVYVMLVSLSAAALVLAMMLPSSMLMVRKRTVDESAS